MLCLGFEPILSRMVGADETTELWRQPQSSTSFEHFFRTKFPSPGLYVFQQQRLLIDRVLLNNAAFDKVN